MSVLLISTKQFNLRVKRLESLSKADLTGVTCLIFNSSQDSQVDLPLALSRVKSTVKKIIYVTDNLSPLLFSLFSGLGADIYDTEDYLQDDESLSFIVDNYASTGETVRKQESNVGVLGNCVSMMDSYDVGALVNAFSNRAFVQSMRKAVDGISTAVALTDQGNNEVITLLKSTGDMITRLETEHAEQALEIKQLSGTISKHEQNMNNKSNTPISFGTYTIPKTISRVIYVKAYSPCRYLKSFFTSYQHYLRNNKQLSCRLLIAVPRLKQLLIKYRDFPRLGTDTINMVDVSQSDIFITYEPHKSVLDAFFNRDKKPIEVFIVIDEMYGDDLMAGLMLTKVFAVGGVSDIERFELKNDRTFMPLLGVKGTMALPHFKGYRESSDSNKRAMYYETCGSHYKLLDTLLKV